MKVERRYLKAEVRKSADGRTIIGRAVVFGQRSENLGGFVEQIDPNAFDGCDMSDVRCLFNHDDNLILGRTKSGNTRLTLGAEGLDYECDLPETTCGRDLAVSMDRGDVDQSSFSFVVAPGGSDWDEEPGTGVLVRTIKKIARLFDVSPVTFPAYIQTSSEVRSFAEILSERQIAAPPVPNAGGVAVDPLLRHKTELAFHQYI